MPLRIFPQTDEKPFLKYSSWLLLQAVPSPVIYQNKENGNNRINFGLRWQIIPLNYSFSANKYVSNIQSFFIKPVRRFAGSAEIFIQPEVTFSDFDNGKFNNFWISGGTRLILPVTAYGEVLSASIGVKYNFHKNISDSYENYPGIEGGVYFMGGLGVQANYNLNEFNKINFGLFFKYY